MKKCCLAVLFMVMAASAQAQQNRIITVESPAYSYISQLQHHGYLLELNPTALPYTQDEVYEALQELDEGALSSSEQQWVGLLAEQLRPNGSEETNSVRYGIDFKASTYVGNSRRKNVLRPVDDGIYSFPRVSLGGYIENEHFVANLNIRHDLYYDRDPDGLDSANRLYMRSEDAYLGYNGDWLNVYAGRFSNHWAPYGETSSILSSNPQSFDQINIRLGNEKISLRSVFGELDNISANNNYTGSAFWNGSKRRFLVAHRFDWRPTKHFGMAFFESVIYSGTNSGFSVKYFNPLHTYTFVTDNSPKNDENNLLLGGMLWFQWRGLTFNSQLMLDDFQVETNIEKHTFTFTSSVYKADLFDNVDLGAEFEAVSYQTYNPEQPEGRYLYLKRGLATQFNDYIRGSVYTHLYMSGSLSGLRLTPKLQLLLQGEQTINQPLVKTYPDGSPIDYILTGDEEQTVRPSLAFRYQKSPHFWLEGNIGANFVKDVNNRPGVDETRFAGFLKLGVDFSFFE